MYKTRRYILGLIATLMVLSSCRSNYEWININPDKIQKARKYIPQNEKVNKVDITIDLKEKDKTVYYSEPTGFFADQAKIVADNSIPDIKKRNSKSFKKKNLASNFSSQQSFNAPKKEVIQKQSVKKTIPTSNASKLNGALKLPVKPSVKQSQSLNSVNGNIKQRGKTTAEMRSLAFNDIKSKNSEIESQFNQNLRRGQGLLWVGLVLGVAGLVLGFIFGRSAFIISIVGVVFAAIGFFIQR
jgi:hypothetical protein